MARAVICADDGFYQWLDYTWRYHQLLLALILYYIGGWSFVVWGVFVRVAVSVVGHWTITYFCHNSGPGIWRVKGAAVQASNIPGLGIITYGECWHNNHHVFPESARIGIENGQCDPAWRFIQLLAFLRLARNVGGPRTAELRDDLDKIALTEIVPAKHGPDEGLNISFMNTVKSISNILLSILLIVFSLALFGSQWESGRHAAHDDTLRSEWYAGLIFGRYEYFRKNTEFVFDKSSEAQGTYFIISSWFSYYDEPHVHHKPAATGKIERYLIDLDVAMLGLSASLFVFFLMFLTYKNVLTICEGKRQPYKKYLVDLILLCLPLILAFYQAHRVQNPSWRIHDQIAFNERYVEWDKAVGIIKSGKVSTIFQEHSRVVSIILSDGSSYVSLEPAIDKVYSIVDKCGLPCEKITLWTE